MGSCKVTERLNLCSFIITLNTPAIPPVELVTQLECYTISRLIQSKIIPKYIKKAVCIGSANRIDFILQQQNCCIEGKGGEWLTALGPDQFSCIQGLPVLWLICFVGELSHPPFFIQLELNSPEFLDSP